jgi:hypothetical protein
MQIYIHGDKKLQNQTPPHETENKQSLEYRFLRQKAASASRVVQRTPSIVFYEKFAISWPRIRIRDEI